MGREMRKCCRSFSLSLFFYFKRSHVPTCCCCYGDDQCVLPVCACGISVSVGNKLLLSLAAPSVFHVVFGFEKTPVRTVVMERAGFFFSYACTIRFYRFVALMYNRLFFSPTGGSCSSKSHKANVGFTPPKKKKHKPLKANMPFGL